MRQHKNERMHKPYISLERSEKHSFWMLGGAKWSSNERTFGSVVTSIRIFEVKRNGFAL